MELTQMTLTEHIAKKTMELKDVNICLSFVHMIWRDKPLMVVFNNLNNQIMSTWFAPILQDGDLDTLEQMVKDFLNK